MTTEAGLILEGVAAQWTLDRENEAFAFGAFDAALKTFLETNPILAWSHATAIADTVKGPSGYVQLGRVLELTKDPERGLLFKAWFPKPVSGFLLDVYNQVRAGIQRGVSVGGRFLKDAATGLIHKVDLHEVSIAPKPVGERSLIERVTPVAEAPVFLPVEQGKACPLPAGDGFHFQGDPIAAGKAYVAGDPLAAFAAGLRDVRATLALREQRRRESALAEVRADLERIRAWSP
jgi:hypothetical protein